MAAILLCLAIVFECDILDTTVSRTQVVDGKRLAILMTMVSWRGESGESGDAGEEKEKERWVEVDSEVPTSLFGSHSLQSGTNT